MRSTGRPPQGEYCGAQHEGAPVSACTPPFFGRSCQRGIAALAVVLVVATALALTAAYASRVAWLELKASGNRVRAVQAAEAAESGLAWGLARFNDDRPVDNACRPAPSGPTFRERYQDASAMPSCVFSDGVWSCQCPPATGAVPATGAEAVHQAFALRLGSAASGVSTIEAIGCSGVIAACLLPPGPGVPAGIHVTRAWADVARIPAIDVRPVAAITVRGMLRLRDAPTVIHHRVASGGLTLHTGAAVDPGDAALVGPPGAPPLSTVVGGDAALASLDGAQFFASAFRMNRAAWRAQPAAQAVDCKSACDQTLAQRLAGQGAPSLVWLDGGLHLDGATELGSPERPVLLVIDGPVHLRGPVRIHGVLYLRSAEWRDNAGADIHGALLAENDLLLTGPSRIQHDSSIVERLHLCCGTYARVPGSWRDF
jgi:Tfp pilus assembly protein PilX